MIWWIRQRGALGLLPAALLAFVLGTAMTSGVVVVLPSFLGHYATVTELSNFVALIPGVAVIACLERRMPSVERSAVRRVDARDILLVSGFALLATAAAAGMSLLGPDATLAAARNNLLFCGLALGAWPLIGHRAPLVPVFWMIQAMFLGGRSRDDPHPWVIVTEAPQVAHAAVGAAAVFLAGLLSLRCFTSRTDR
ncbi:hypothetical protein [Streptomyces clavuligerus]|uniref:Uncharacterized protein n=1 Tax=Streptomyces clavuligerus TaxID=1901 RepID=B5GWR2_STRCL|nr:hypothetical protein [Streptomyces clavuligerus]ANW16942.1 hypothetical protein BB341_01210 [Streptomyces clavuligerus]AXU11471.1 hypothetical protein D1794_01285 [Streptomyces clavuligerus]EDY50758.1 hypothetical protein SSCG_03438 [Streptomyces clavuligerus]EFG10532.1 Hypothetical protein SCLAV_5465 [Streptomyces clavuligerus]MBY6301290.1 hypothetical protein [Streptomyces clavuligerus]